jgi:ABC-type uncharacterized transport system permease subunit
MLNKNLAIIFSLVLISVMTFGILSISESFHKNKWVVEVSYCNSDKIDTLNVTTIGKENYISTYREAVPVLHIGNSKFLNICKYEVLSITAEK